MMNSNKQIQYIAEYFAGYSSYIEYQNTNGFFDAARKFEGFAREICNLWFECKFDLTSSSFNNYPYIDLISDDRLIGVQVSTSKHTAEKIIKTLERAVEYANYSDINLDHLYFFCLYPVKGTRAYRIMDEYRLRIDTEIITLEDVLRRADSDLEFQRNLYDFLIYDTYYFQVNSDLYEGSGIKGYYNYVNKLYKSSLGGSSLSNDDLVRSYIPLYCYAADGEKEKLETVIVDFVTKTANGVIWIVGEAGSGKTTMCLKAVNSSDQSIFSSNRVYWVRFIDLINNDGSIDSSDIEFYRELIWNDKNDTKYSKSTKLEIEKNSILYIDGYDEISIEDLERLCIDVKEVSGTLFEFAKKYNLHIIVTSRPNAIEGKYQGSLENGTAAILLKKKSSDNYIPIFKIAPFAEQIHTFKFVLTDKKPSRYKVSSIYLVKTYMENDEYKTAYNMYTSYQTGYLDLIGTVKIAFVQMNPDEFLQANSFIQLDKNYYSLGQSEEYYMNLYGCFSEDSARSILQALQDIAYDDKIFKRYRKDNAMRFSLMQSISELTIRDSFKDLARGNTKQIRYRFDYTLYKDADMKTEEKISFDVNPVSALPSNMYALVGRNGVGKSKLISDMISVIERNKKDYFHEYDADEFQILDDAKNIFNNLVFVSYSVFDEIGSAFEEKRTIPLDYIGIRSVNNIKKQSPYVINKNMNELSDDFSNALIRCINLGKKSLWTEVIEILNSDPMFRNSNVSSLLSSTNLSKTILASADIFEGLSSGHKIVLLTLTQLVAVVKERTLLFIDEPELHLHPPLVASYIKAVSYLLRKKNGVAIIATHSPVVLQEIPSKCVWHINRSGTYLTAKHPRIQTYGENLGVITKEIFRHEIEDTGYRKVLSMLSDEGLSFDEIMDRLDNQLGIEGQMLLSMVLEYRDEKNRET